MKHKLLAVLLLLALLLSLMSCGNKTEHSPYTDADFDASGEIVISVEYPVYDKSVTSFRYAIENHSDRELTFGAAYAIEWKKDGAWQSLPLKEDAAWNEIAYLLKPGETWSNAFSFFVYDYEVADGQYRLIKTIDGRRYAAEFSIGESHITAEDPFGYVTLEKLPAELELDDLAYDLRINAAGQLAGGSGQRVEAFLDQVAQGSPAMLRIVCEGIGSGPTLYDIIYQNEHFLCRRDATRSGTETIEDHRYSFLVTDGACIYLSDAASLDREELSGRAINAGRYTILQQPWFADWDALTSRVEEMTEQHLAGSVVLARFWSDDGTYWLDLTKDSMDYLVSTKGYTMGRTLTECVSDEPLEIVTVRWESPTQARLLCLPVAGETSSREPGWYAVFDVEEERIVSDGRSIWQTSYQSSGAVGKSQ